MTRAGLVLLLCVAVPAVALGQPGAGTTVRGAPLTSTSVSPITGGQTLYLTIDGSDVSGTQTEVQTRMPAVLLKNLRCYTSTAPGAGKTVAVTLQTGVCGTALADTALTCSVSGTGTPVGNDITNAVALTADICVCYKVVYDSGAAASYPRAEIQAY